MRIAIRHRTHYAYGSPAKSVMQLLRLTPRNHDGQNVKRWRIDLNCDGALKAGEDPFGNLTHTLSLAGPISDLEVSVEGEVETEDRHGIVRGTYERFPVGLYLRETPLTETNAELKEFAHDVTSEATTDRLELLHLLLIGIYSTIKFDTTPTNSATPATEAFKLRRGVCQDLTHIFLACARHLGVPARYVGGYMLRNDGVTQQEAGHAWAEADVEGLGWIGFDPANGICPTEGHVRVAAGLDYLGAAPIRGTRQGGADEQMRVAVQINQARSQWQSQ
jgi:transglutaminase-like putative cysteine protease